LQPWDNRYPKLLADWQPARDRMSSSSRHDVLIRFAEANAIVPAADYVPAEVFAGYEQPYTDEVSLDGKAWFRAYDREVMLHLANLDLLEQVDWDTAALPATLGRCPHAVQAVQDLAIPS